MNYIKRLQMENAAYADTLHTIETQTLEIIQYLSSAKFSTDDYVNRNDILPRLIDIRLNATE